MNDYMCEWLMAVGTGCDVRGGKIWVLVAVYGSTAIQLAGGGAVKRWRQIKINQASEWIGETCFFAHSFFLLASSMTTASMSYGIWHWMFLTPIPTPAAIRQSQFVAWYYRIIPEKTERKDGSFVRECRENVMIIYEELYVHRDRYNYVTKNLPVV